MIHRKEIDGFRALAVLSVIFFHAGFSSIPGGFVGVDIFFVISGFLITSILLNGLATNTFSLFTFYERRIRRIIPALFVMVLLITPIAWMMYGLDDMKNYAQSVGATALFASNILFWREAGYFGPIAELKPLLHTWSLAIEEQYYILFPIFLLWTKNLPHKWIFFLLIVAGLISISIAELTLQSNRDFAAFFLLPARGWEILLGAYGAFFLFKNPRNNISIQLQSFLSILGLVMVLCSIFFFDEHTPSPGLFILIPTFGTLLMIIFSNQTNLVGRFFSNKLFVFLGLISYSAYLWHQPFFAFAKFLSLDELNLYENIIIILGTFFLAYLSWRFIEQPFRDKNYISSKKIYSFTFIGIAAFIIFGLVGNISNGYPSRLSTSAVNFFNGWTYQVNYDCQSYAASPRNPLKPCTSNKEAIIETFLIGDSHAFFLSGPLNKELSILNQGFFYLPASGCNPAYRSGPNLKNFCNTHNSILDDSLKKSKNIKNIIIHASWIGWFQEEKLKNNSTVAIKQAIEDMLDYYEALNLNIFLVYPTPVNKVSIPRMLWLRHLFGKEYLNQSSQMHVDLEIIEFFDLLSKKKNIYPVKPYSSFCTNSNSEYRSCKISNDRHPLYSDRSHLAPEGNKILARQISKEYFSNLTLE